MAKIKYITIQTERGPTQVRSDLVWGNSSQPVDDKRAEHLASGSRLLVGLPMPKVIDTSKSKDEPKA